MDVSALVFLIVIGVAVVVAACLLGSRMKAWRNAHLVEDLAELRNEVANLRLEVDRLRDKVGPADEPANEAIKVKRN